MNAKVGHKPESIFFALLGLVVLVMFPVDSVLAYSHDVRDDQGQLNTAFFKTTNVNETWINQSNSNNGYDYDTAVDCLEEYSDCVSPGTSDTATWYPDPNPSPYWMCPFTHIAKQPTWSDSMAQYDTYAGSTNSYSTMFQEDYLNAWYALPNGDFHTGDNVEVTQIGQGGGAMTADATDFHYNPYNANDSACH